MRTSRVPALLEALTGAGMAAGPVDGDPDAVSVSGSDMTHIGDLALSVGAPIHELRPLRSDLERLFLDLTETPEHRNRNLGAPPGALVPAGSPPSENPEGGRP